MVTNSINSQTKTPSSNDTVFNPKSKLDKDAFLKLFITQLEHQDPTNPMDTDKMLEQTSYLSTMEMNNNMQQTINNLANTLKMTSTISTISAIGKMADTGDRYISVTDDDNSKKFDLYFNDDISSGNITIKDKNGNIIKTMPLNAHTKGVLSFNWDLKDANGNRVSSDKYEISATYTSPDGKEHKTALGAYPIEAVQFDNGKALAKLGSKYIPFDEIKQIYQWEE